MSDDQGPPAERAATFRRHADGRVETLLAPERTRITADLLGSLDSRVAHARIYFPDDVIYEITDWDGCHTFGLTRVQ